MAEKNHGKIREALGEQLKQRFDGKSYRDYQKAKYKFFNRILEEA